MQHKVDTGVYRTVKLARGEILEVKVAPHSTVNLRRLALPGYPAVDRFHEFGLLQTQTVQATAEEVVQLVGPFQDIERTYAIEVVGGSAGGATYEVGTADVSFA